MENVVVHIISHSHWDREWYLPFESHRMQLVELFDNLFDLFENDPEFKSFHLDGQTIVLDDYLEIRPENRDKVQRYIDEGKLKIGPFYILQDDYLISSEANVRNTLIGQAECAKWGKINPDWLLPRYLWKYGAGSSNPSKIRYSRSSLWSRCQANRI